MSNRAEPGRSLAHFQALGLFHVALVGNEVFQAVLLARQCTDRANLGAADAQREFAVDAEMRRSVEQMARLHAGTESTYALLCQWAARRV